MSTSLYPGKCPYNNSHTKKKLNVVTYFKVKQQQQHFDEAEKCVRLAVCLASSLVWSNHTSHLSRLLLLHCSARSHHSTPRC